MCALNLIQCALHFQYIHYTIYTLYTVYCTVAGLFTGAQGAVRGGEEGGEGEDSSGGQEEGDVQVGLQEWRSGL